MLYATYTFSIHYERKDFYFQKLGGVIASKKYADLILLEKEIHNFFSEYVKVMYLLSLGYIQTGGDRKSLGVFVFCCRAGS